MLLSAQRHLLTIPQHSDGAQAGISGSLVNQRLFLWMHMSSSRQKLSKTSQSILS